MCQLFWLNCFLLVNIPTVCGCSSVPEVVYNSLRHQGLRHAWLPWPSLSPDSDVCSDSCLKLVMPSNHLILYHLFSFCLPSFPASGSFLMSCLLTSDGQSIKVSASASVLSINIQGWFPLGLTSVISLQSKGLSSLQHHNSKASVLWRSALYMVQNSYSFVHDYWKNHSFEYTDLCVCFFNMLCRRVTAFLPKSKCLLISWLRSPSTVILEPKKIKPVTVSTFPPSFCHEVMGCMPWS